MAASTTICRREVFRWMGSHSGYDPLFDVIPRVRPGHYGSVHARASAPTFPGAQPVLGWLRRRARGSPFYNARSTCAELELLLGHRQADLVHVSYVENQLGWAARARVLLRAALVGTVHQPARWYAVLGLLAEPGERAQRSKAARAFAEAELSWDRCARETLAVYDSVLGRRGEAA